MGTETAQPISALRFFRRSACCSGDGQGQSKRGGVLDPHGLTLFLCFPPCSIASPLAFDQWTGPKRRRGEDALTLYSRPVGRRLLPTERAGAKDAIGLSFYRM